MRVGLLTKLSAEELLLFELWCWRILLRIPWTARRSNQSILKEISPECSLEGLMLKLKLQGELWPPHVKNWLIGKDPDAGREWGQEKKGTTEDEIVGWHCWRRNETPTLQSGLNLYILTLASYSCFILYPLHKNLGASCQALWFRDYTVRRRRAR